MATTTSSAAPTALTSVILEVADVETARHFYRAFGVDAYITLRASEAARPAFAASRWP